MMHPLVQQLRYARQRLMDSLEGLSEEDAGKRLGNANSIGWIVGHLACFEQSTHCEATQGITPSIAVKDCDFGKPASTPSLKAMVSDWQKVTAQADVWLETLTEADMHTKITLPDGRPFWETTGTMLLRHTWHYWYHNGEALAIRQALGHDELHQMVGKIAYDARFHVNPSKQLVDDMYGGLNENVLGLMQTYWTEDMVWEGPAGIGTMNGIDEFEHVYREPFIKAFPDKHATDIVRIAEGDWVAGTGYQDTTFAEDWIGLKASGEKIRMRYMDFWRTEVNPETGERKLKENLVLIDILGVLEQTGYNIENVLKFIGSKPPEFFDEQ